MKKKLLCIIVLLIFICSVFLVACDDETSGTSSTPSNTSNPTSNTSGGVPTATPDTGITTSLTLSDVQSILTADIFADWQGRKIYAEFLSTFGGNNYKDILEMTKNEDTMLAQGVGFSNGIEDGTVKIYMAEDIVYRQRFQNGDKFGQDSVLLSIFLANPIMYGTFFQLEKTTFQQFEMVTEHLDEVFESATKTLYSDGTYKIKLTADTEKIITAIVTYMGAGTPPADFFFDYYYMEFIFGADDSLTECRNIYFNGDSTFTQDCVYKAEKYNDEITAPDWLADFE